MTPALAPTTTGSFQVLPNHMSQPMGTRLHSARRLELLPFSGATNVDLLGVRLHRWRHRQADAGGSQEVSADR